MGMFYGRNKSLGYGLLYNIYAAIDSRNVAPIGCHVPTQTELSTLATYLGGALIAGGKLKKSGLSHWDSPNTSATNIAGFTGLGSGLRDNTGFNHLRRYGFGWTSDINSPGRYYILWMQYNSAELLFPGTVEGWAGIPIRCICDTSDSIITDIDGNVYNTVVIGTQRWLTQNLKVTKYRNGDSIPEVTDNTTWAGLTTGALCAYDNDWSYV